MPELIHQPEVLTQMTHQTVSAMELGMRPGPGPGQGPGLGPGPGPGVIHSSGVCSGRPAGPL